MDCTELHTLPLDSLISWLVSIALVCLAFESWGGTHSSSEILDSEVPSSELEIEQILSSEFSAELLTLSEGSSKSPKSSVKCSLMDA